MSNYESTNDLYMMPHLQDLSEVSSHKSKLLHLKKISDHLLKAYEGFLLSVSCSMADTSEQLRAEASSHQEIYITMVGDAHDELTARLKEIYAYHGGV